MLAGGGGDGSRLEQADTASTSTKLLAVLRREYIN
jgi:hypothetical protein